MRDRKFCALIFVCLLFLVPRSSSSMVVGAGLKTWFGFSTQDYPGEQLGEYEDKDRGPLHQYVFYIGPSVNLHFNRNSSLSAYALFGIKENYAFYRPYTVEDESDTASTGTENSDESYFEKFSADAIMHFEAYAAYNMRLNNMITAFLGVKIFSVMNSGNYSISYSSKGKAEGSLEGEQTDLYIIADSYNAGGGFTFNNHIAGNYFLLTTISYFFNATTLNINYADIHQSGTLLCHAPVLKIGVAHLYPDSQMTLEFGVQAQYSFCQASVSDDPYIKKFKNSSSITIGPVVNLSKTF